MIVLTNKIDFPSLSLSEPNGLLAIGGDLSFERLLLAYQSGIFPWFNEGEIIQWWSPLERMVLFPDELKISKSSQQLLRKEIYTFTVNQSFQEVVHHCQSIKRKGEQGTWITNEMEEAYTLLHKKGYAKSIEVWEGEELVGGLYGVEIGTVFCGESMFSLKSNTSKLAFTYLVQSMAYQLIDCQMYNPHLASLGAREISRADFLQRLQEV